MATCTDEERKLLDAVLSGQGLIEARRAVRLELLRTEPALVDLLTTARQRMRDKAQAFEAWEQAFASLESALGIRGGRDSESGWLWEVIEGKDP